MIEGLASNDAFLRDTAAVYLLKHDPGMASKALDAIADQIVNPMDGGHLLWDLVKDVRRSLSRLAGSPGDIAGRAPLAGPGSPTAASMRSWPWARSDRKPDRPSLRSWRNPGPETWPLATRAVEALVKIDPRSAAARLPSLLDWMTPGHDRGVRLTAMAALRDLGPAATAAIPP